MKGGVFGKWFKELATLVFTQTVQAFLLAVVMSIVISAMSGAKDSSGKATRTTMAGGLLAIIALSQFSKLEMLVKNIFGIKSDMDVMRPNPGGLTAGALMAWKGAKRFADNGSKIAGGAIGAINSQRRLSKLNDLKDAQERDNQLAAANAFATGAEGSADLAEGNAALAEAGLGQANDMVDALGQDFVEGTQTAAAVNMAYGNQNGSGGSGGGNLGVTSTDINNLITALNNQTEALKNSSNKTGDAGALGSGSSSSSSNPSDSIDERIRQEKLKRQESLRKMGTGFSETVGSLGGATVGLAGAAISVGMGKDLGDAAQTVLAGVGMGDAMGEKAAKTAYNVQDMHRDNKALKVEVNGGTAYNSKFQKVSSDASVKQRMAAANDGIASAQVRGANAAQREANAKERTVSANQQKQIADAISKKIIKEMPKRGSYDKQGAKNYIASVDKRKANAGNID